MAELRVASLLPAATEIVCVVGARDSLVGVSHECDFPPGVERLPVLTRARTRPPAPAAANAGAALPPPSSRAIDAEVRRVLAEATSVYEVDVEGLRRVRPDVVVTQDLCEVCAVSRADVERAAREVLAADARIVSLSPTRLADVLDDVRRVAEALGRAEEGRRVAAELETRLARLRARTAGLPRPAAVTLEWLAPPMIGGTWMPELVEIAGGLAVGARAGEPARASTPAELRALGEGPGAPEVVVAKPCGFDLARTLAEVDLLLELVRDAGWPAGRTGRVYAADGSAYFNRPGPRLVESAEILAACLNPESFPDLAARHAGSYRRVG